MRSLNIVGELGKYDVKRLKNQGTDYFGDAVFSARHALKSLLFFT